MACCKCLLATSSTGKLYAPHEVCWKPCRQKLLFQETKVRARNNHRVGFGVGWDRWATPSQNSHLEKYHYTTNSMAKLIVWGFPSTETLSNLCLKRKELRPWDYPSGFPHQQGVPCAHVPNCKHSDSTQFPACAYVRKGADSDLRLFLPD
jgi:hypothetical protein